MNFTAEAQREADFQRYIESNIPYVAKIEEAGDVPWHENDIEARRELFMRRYRYSRPAPPSAAVKVQR